MNLSPRAKFAVMMFLECCIWGAWLPLIFGSLPSLGFNPEWQQPLILGAFNVAAVVALFFSTQFVDRNFAAEKFLAFSMLVGGLAIAALFLLPGKIGAQPGEHLVVKALKAGPEPNQAIGALDDGTKVLIEDVHIDWTKVEADDAKKPV